MTSPWPDFPLPVKVADLEIANSVPPLGGCEAYGSVQLLLRRRGRPLGWVGLTGGRATIPPAEIERAMHRRLRDWNGRAAIVDALPSPPPAPRPPISVVVCTRDRADLLERCLQALSRLEYPHYEIVVVDNASTTSETQRVAAVAGVRYEVEPCPGLDWARNRGLAAARYDIIVYTDDDTEVDPGWLAAIAEAFQDPEVRGVTGFVMPGALDTEAEVLFELCYGGMGKGMMPRDWDPAAMSDFERIGAHHVGVGANMAFRRGLLEQLGGFDTALDVGTPSHGGGDLDIFHRGLMAGAVLCYQPAAIVRHYHRREMAALRRQHYDNGLAFGVYLLTILKRGDIPRATTLWYAVRVWLGWLAGRVIRRFRRRELLPMPLLLAELWGAAHAPWAYLATRRSDRARRKSRDDSNIPGSRPRS